MRTTERSGWPGSLMRSVDAGARLPQRPSARRRRGHEPGPRRSGQGRLVLFPAGITGRRLTAASGVPPRSDRSGGEGAGRHDGADFRLCLDLAPRPSLFSASSPEAQYTRFLLRRAVRNQARRSTGHPVARSSPVPGRAHRFRSHITSAEQTEPSESIGRGSTSHRERIDRVLYRRSSFSGRRRLVRPAGPAGHPATGLIVRLPRRASRSQSRRARPSTHPCPTQFIP